MGVGAKRVLLKHPQTGQMKSGFYGFSWTYLLFGFWVPLLRGEIGIAALHLLFSLVTFGLWQLIVSWLYNAQYTNRRIAEGFRFSDTPANNAAAASAVGVDLGAHQGAIAR